MTPGSSLHCSLASLYLGPADTAGFPYLDVKDSRACFETYRDPTKQNAKANAAKWAKDVEIGGSEKVKIMLKASESSEFHPSSTSSS